MATVFVFEIYATIACDTLLNFVIYEEIIIIFFSLFNYIQKFSTCKPGQKYVMSKALLNKISAGIFQGSYPKNVNILFKIIDPPLLRHHTKTLQRK